jgi:hypothetical protein
MHNQLLQYVPGLKAHHRAPFSSLRYEKGAAEQ